MILDTANYDVFIITGRTDMRKGIDGLATLVQDQYSLNVYSNSLFLFAGLRKDRYKILYFDNDGFVILNKRLDNGKLKWPKGDEKIMKLSQQQFRWLLEGLNIEQPKSVKPSLQGKF